MELKKALVNNKEENSTQTEKPDTSQYKSVSLQMRFITSLSILSGTAILLYITFFDFHDKIEAILLLFTPFLFFIVIPVFQFRHTELFKETSPEQKRETVTESKLKRKKVTVSKQEREIKYIQDTLNKEKVDYQKLLQELRPLLSVNENYKDYVQSLISDVESQLQNIQTILDRIETKWDLDIPQKDIKELYSELEELYSELIHLQKQFRKTQRYVRQIKAILKQ